MKRKLLALLLCAMMLLTAIPNLAVTAFAETVEDTIVTVAQGIEELFSRGTTGIGTNYPGGSNVLVIAPYEETDRDVWDDTSETVGAYMASLLGGECVVLEREEANNADILDAIFSGDYAVILVDSHGSPSSFSTRAANGSLTSFNATTITTYLSQTGNSSKTLNNALVYFASCSIMSGYQNEGSLCDVLLDAGAGAVVGDTVISYAYSNMKQIFTWCLTGFYDGTVHTMYSAFQRAIAASVNTFVYAGDVDWKLYENNGIEPINGGSGTCGTNVAYELIRDNTNNKVLLHIYPTSKPEEHPTYNYDMSSYSPSFSLVKSAITHVVIENGVTSIGDYAFSYCSSLTSVTIPDSVESIGDYAFSYCSSLTYATISDSVTSIGIGVFAGCASLISIYVDADNPNYSSDVSGALFNKDKTTLLFCPSTLTSIIIPGSVTFVCNSAFSYGHIASVTFLDGGEGTTIDCEAFLECYNLETLILCNSVETIGEAAFQDCDALTSVTIPNSVTLVGASAFRYCDSLAYVTFSNGGEGTTIDFEAFCDCDNLETLILSNSVETIGEEAFYGCDALTSVVIPDSLEYLACYAFGDCPLESVYLQGNLNSGDLNWLTYEDGDGDSTYLFDNNPVVYYLDGGYINSEDLTMTPYKTEDILDENDDVIGTTPCLFAGWYSETISDLVEQADKTVDPDDITDFLEDNERDEPMEVHAGWQAVGTVEKATADEKQVEGHEYLGFEEIGVQKRLRYEQNGVQQYPEGLRFVTVFSDELLTSIDAANAQSLSYGYAVCAKNTFETLHGNADIQLGMTKVKEIDCTSNGTTVKDHQRFTDCAHPYRMFTFVVTYDGADTAAKSRQLIARPYIKYKDAQGVDRVYYFNYGSNGGTSVHSGCCASFNSVDYIYPGVRQ